MKIFKDQESDLIVAKDDNNSCIVKFKKEFYKLDNSDFINIFGNKNLFFVKEITDYFLIPLIMAIVIVASMVIYLKNGLFVLIDNNFLVANLILISNVVLHEFGHALFLKMFYRESKLSIGFKLFFIYPALYVDTSYSYFLPKYKRISVYMAGNFLNCLYLLISFIIFKDLVKYNYLIVSTVLINFLPIIKSDGYYAACALIGKYNKELSKTKTFADDFIRGFLMFVVLYFFSKI